MNVLYRKYRSLLHHIRFRNERFKDWAHAVDFTTRATKEQAGTSEFEGALYYESSAFVPELKKALDYLNINASDAILDYGSGKGALLAKLSRYPFRRVCGIELSEALIKISKENFRNLKIDTIEIIKGDATTFTAIDDFNYFYFFNPFSGEVFRRVMENILLSYETHPRSICLIYYHPKCDDIIMASGRFNLTRQFVDGTRILNIYTIISK